MVKHSGLAMVFLALLLFSCFISTTPPVKSLDSNEAVNGRLSVTSPVSNVPYKGNMSITVQIAWSMILPVPWIYASIAYSIDDHYPVALTNETTLIFKSSASNCFSQADSVIDISHLASGKHKLTIIAQGSYNINNDFVNTLDYRFEPVYFYVDYLTPPILQLQSPQRQTYDQANIPLNFTVDSPPSWTAYCLDNQGNTTITGNQTLTDLSDGTHTLIVYVTDTNNLHTSKSVQFTIAVPPHLTILSPHNQNYTTQNIDLTFTTDKPLSWSSYTLDSGENVTLAGNTTLVNVPDGLHSIIVYGNGTFGGFSSSQNVTFSVSVPLRVNPEQSSILIIVAICICIITVTCLGIYLKFIRPKHSGK